MKVMLVKTQNKKRKRNRKGKNGPPPIPKATRAQPNRRKAQKAQKAKSVPLAYAQGRNPTKLVQVQTTHKGDWCRVEGKDYLTTVQVSTVAGAVGFQTIFAPGFFTNTRLGKLAYLYERYRALHLAFHYEPAASATTVGSFVGYVDYDVNDEVVSPGDLHVAFGHKGAKATSVWEKCSWFFTDLADRREMTDLYTSVDLSVMEADNAESLKMFSPCRFVIMTNVPAAALTTVGSLSMSYKIDFFIPQLQPDPDSTLALSTGTFDMINSNQNMIQKIVDTAGALEANVLGMTRSPLQGTGNENYTQLNAVKAGDYLGFLEGWTHATLVSSTDLALNSHTNLSALPEIVLNAINTVVNNVGTHAVFRRTVGRASNDNPRIRWHSPIGTQTGIVSPSLEILRLSKQAYDLWNSNFLACDRVNKESKVSLSCDEVLTTAVRRRSKMLNEQLCDCSPVSEHDGACPTFVKPYYSKYVQSKVDEGKSSCSFDEYVQKWKSPLFRANQIAKFTLGGTTEFKLKS